MADIQFDESQQYRPTVSQQPSFIEGLVYKTGLAKDPQGVQYVLIGIAIFAIVVALFVFFSSTSTSRNAPLPPIPGNPSGVIPAQTQ